MKENWDGTIAVEYVDGDYETAVRRSNMRAISDARAAEWAEAAAEQKGAQVRTSTCSNVWLARMYVDPLCP